MLRYCLAGMLLFLPLALHASPTWSRATVGKHPISVELPGTPSASHSTSSWGPFGTAETDAIEVQAHGGTMAAFATVAPSWAIKGAGLDLIVMTSKDKVIGKRRGRVRSSERIKRRGVSGKRLTYAFKEADAQRVGTLEVFVRDPFIVIFDVTVPEGTSPEIVERFFASIRMFE